MKYFLSIIFYIIIGTYAQNLTTNPPDNNSSNPLTESPLTLDAKEPTRVNQQNSSSCPEGYECYPVVFCENINLKTDSASSQRCPNGEVCCRRNQTDSQASAAQNKCGIRNIDGVGFRITNSDDETETSYGEFPWMIIILVKNYTDSGKEINVYQSGGSLIHPSVVLTAAHRVSGLPTNILKIRAGEWDTSTISEIFDHQDRNVAQVLIHGDFEAGNLQNDIALVFLENPVVLAEHIMPVCLPPPDANFDQRRCIATGWGKDIYGKTGRQSFILKKVDLPVVPLTECLSLLQSTRLSKHFELHDSFICAGGEVGKDTCNGDGGSPLVCSIASSSKQYYQIGVVAWGIGCGDNNIPAVYANVAKFRKWIDDVMIEKGLGIDSYTP